MGMTREEAARIIKECKEKGFKYTFYTVEVYYTALDIAIKAIEQQEAIEECTCCEYRVGGECCYAEVEQTEDAISREVARRIIDSGRNKEQMLEMLNNTPSVNSQPKTGHWIENAPEYQNIDPPYICSECGNMHLKKTNYCDQCGAKMVEPQESEDKE